ncbi:MoxR family ATPase [Cellulomonas sp. JZ18]|uniref:AAA family ATPase n=1 Tax=Cellulomonas sp. JZ18 TaxID=2654191 RepID=UPI001E50E6E1|nr:MoxR family ATPase [Cellulomonas sp. JZ18]
MPPRDTLGSRDLQRAVALTERIERVFDQRVVGQEGLRTSLVVALMCGGHILLESVPGLAKTTAAQTLAHAVSGSFHRIQCTPDLMPSDIVGTQVFHYGTGQFTTQLGPVHANVVLLDEINRSSAKTQSAMLEAMQEKQTTIAGEVHRLPQPFMVLATQNPIEEEGTHVLPEAQMDRFLLKEVLDYPDPAEEVEILERISDGRMARPLDAPRLTLDEVRWLQEAVDQVYVDASIRRYVVDLVATTRGRGPVQVPGHDRLVRMGASPRGSISLMRVAQAVALRDGRSHVTPDDVRALRHAVLRHRVVRTFDALADDVSPESIVDAVFAAVPVP